MSPNVCGLYEGKTITILQWLLDVIKSAAMMQLLLCVATFTELELWKSVT